MIVPRTGLTLIVGTLGRPRPERADGPPAACDRFDGLAPWCSHPGRYRHRRRRGAPRRHAGIPRSTSSLPGWSGGEPLRRRFARSQEGADRALRAETVHAARIARLRPAKSH